jgi:hypothetical protein
VLGGLKVGEPFAVPRLPDVAFPEAVLPVPQVTGTCTLPKAEPAWALRVIVPAAFSTAVYTTFAVPTVVFAEAGSRMPRVAMKSTFVPSGTNLPLLSLTVAERNSEPSQVWSDGGDALRVSEAIGAGVATGVPTAVPAPGVPLTTAAVVEPGEPGRQ